MMAGRDRFSRLSRGGLSAIALAALLTGCGIGSDGSALAPMRAADDSHACCCCEVGGAVGAAVVYEDDLDRVGEGGPQASDALDGGVHALGFLPGWDDDGQQHGLSVYPVQSTVDTFRKKSRGFILTRQWSYETINWLPPVVFPDISPRCSPES